MRFLLLFIAAIIAVFAGIAAMQLSSPTAKIAAITPQTPPVSTVNILVARSAIAPGTVLTSAMFDKQPWPENLVLEGFIPSDSPNADVVGKVTRAAFQAREPLIASKLATTTDSGFLAATLPPGLRAITVATDAVSGIAGFIFPGDRVDILLTHNIPQEVRANEKGASNRPGYSEVLASNVPVLAINIRQATAKEDSSANANNTITPSSLTLQVSDTEVEKIRLAEKVGTLSFALRSISDRKNNTETKPADLLSLTKINMQEAPPEQDDSIKVFRGGDNSTNAASKTQRTQGIGIMK